MTNEEIGDKRMSNEVVKKESDIDVFDRLTVQYDEWESAMEWRDWDRDEFIRQYRVAEKAGCDMSDEWWNE